MEATISTFELIEFAGIIITIIGSVVIINRNLKKGYKSYVDNKMEVMNVQVTTIKKEIIDNKKDNQREHDAIKREFLERVNMIWDWIKEKSA